MQKVTSDEQNMLDYYLNEKGDVTRWSEWEDFSNRHPLIKRLHSEMEDARELLKIVIKNLPVKDEEDD